MARVRRSREKENRALVSKSANFKLAPRERADELFGWKFYARIHLHDHGCVALFQKQPSLDAYT